MCLCVRVRSSYQRYSIKKLFFKISQYSQKAPVLGSLFNNFIKKRLQHRCFSVSIAKFLRTPILKKICERKAASGVWYCRFRGYNIQIIPNIFVFRKMVNTRVAFGRNSGYQSSSKVNGNLASFHFPCSKRDLLQDWIWFVNRPDWKPTINSEVLGELHFDEKFISSGERSKLLWKLDPIPTHHSNTVLKKPSTSPVVANVQENSKEIIEHWSNVLKYKLWTLHTNKNNKSLFYNIIGIFLEGFFWKRHFCINM